ncbi:MAG TPA: DUF4258 domain-containing protein [Chthoniobacterales bacterium]|jgi:hypothetical protein|nr:DUF4258 domain-containing protein [Chthoniobacterales bacterium]
MPFRFTTHALKRLAETRIPRAMVEAVLESPEQRTIERNEIACFQSRVFLDEKEYLLRVFVNETVDPRLVVTVYRTSKIAKYWRT